MHIKTKILFPIVTLTVLVAAAILISNIAAFSGFVDDSTVSRLDAATKVAQNQLDSYKEKATAVSVGIANDPEILRAILDKNHSELAARAGVIQSELGADFCTITDPKGIVIARTHADLTEDSVTNQANIRAAMQGETLTTVEEGTVVRLSVRAGTPVFDEEGAVAGVVSVGYRLDTDQFVDSIKEMMECETTVVLGNERIATTVLKEDGTRAVDTQSDSEIVETVLAGNSWSGRVDILGQTAVANYVPIYGPDGPIGMLFIGQYFQDELKTILDFVQRGVLITAVILVVFIVIILIITGRIVTPILAMTDAATALAAGDTDLDIQVNTKDEMRTLADAFNSMIENTRQQVQVIEGIASGDDAISLHERSEKDVMNRALAQLNKTIQAQAAALKEEHERIKLMLDATPLASRLWDEDYNLIECNEAAVKLFGLKNKQEYIDHYYDLSPEYQPDGVPTREKAKTMIREAFEKGKYVCDYFYQMPDGEPVPAEVTMVRVPYGEKFVVAGYSRDLREQKEMMAEIEQRDKLLQTVNQVADILLRAEPAEFADTLYGCMGMMAGVINADRMYLFKNFTEGQRLYCTQMYEWSENARPLQDTPMMEKVSYDDVAPETKAALLRGESVHKLVHDMASADQIWFGGQDIQSVLISPVFIQNEFWGLVGFDNCHSETLFSENEVSIMRSGSLLIANAWLRNEDIRSIQDTSAKLGVALEDAKNANEAKSNFLAQMSHEIRTPLNVVVGLSELLMDHEEFHEETEKKMEHIHTSGITILNIVNDILDISKIESGKFEIYPVRYDTPSLINDVVTLNIVRIQEKAITFKLFVDENLPGVLFGDDLRVKQIFNNLLSNAFKYTIEGTAEWHISFERDGDDIWLVSSIKDTGIGIKPEDIDKLFSDYNQVDAKFNRKVEGTGLGLAITRRLVEMLDGTISVESEYGQGSTFSVRLRQTYVSDEPIGKEVANNLMGLQYLLSKRARNKKITHVDLSYAHVLIVDDIPTNLDVVKGMLKPYDMKIDCATGGQQAIDMIRSESPRYNAVFMDHMMPGMDGVEAVRIIREEIGTDYARSIPIIALTANAIVGNEEMFLNKGFQAFISKPIDMMKLDAVLRQFVRDKTLENENRPRCVQEESSPLSSVAGVDMRRLLDCFGDDEETVIDVLRSYALNTRLLLNDLNIYLTTGILRDYGIAIHGIKGSSYGIFAQDVGRAAEKLEKSAETGNIASIKDEHEAFLKLITALLDEIDSVLLEVDAVLNKPVSAAPDPAVLKELRAACKGFDMDRVDAAMAKLEAFQYESGGEIVSWLREQVNRMAFEEILEGNWPKG